MKRYFFLTTLICLINCSKTLSEEVIKNNCKGKDLVIYSSKKKMKKNHDLYNISLLVGFSDTITISLNDKKIYKKYVKTNESTSFGNKFIINAKNNDTIKINLTNGHCYKFLLKKEYCIYYIYNLEKYFRINMENEVYTLQ